MSIKKNVLTGVIGLASIAGLVVPQIVTAKEPIGTARFCLVYVDQNDMPIPYGQLQDKVQGDVFYLNGMYPYPVPSTGKATGVLPTIIFNAENGYNTDILPGGFGEPDALCETLTSVDVQGDYYYDQLQQQYGPNGAWSEAKYHDNFEAGVNTLAQLRPYDGSLFDGNAANDATRVVRADGNLNLNMANPSKTVVMAVKLQANR